MGNLCGKPSTNFSSPGRVLGAAPPAAGSTATTTPVPQKYAIRGKGRTLAPASASSSDSPRVVADDPRSAAAAAAEARNSRQPTGKLASRLDEQKRKSHNQHLAELGKTKGQREQLVWD